MPRKPSKKASEPKRKAGRPPSIVVDEKMLEQVKMIAGLQCSQGEAAVILKISRSTFEGLLRNNEKVRQSWDDGKDSGKASLRRLQFENAKAGNTSMQIWLGKQWLGQKDKHEYGGDAQNPMTFTITTGVPRADDN